MSEDQYQAEEAKAHTFDELRVYLEQTEAETPDHKDLLKRVQADYTNYKRRVEEERIEQINLAGARLIERLLPIIDDFERALKAVPAEHASSEWSQGIALIRGKLMSLLEQEGLSRVEAEGKQFNPAEHEAVAVVEVKDLEKGKIAVVHQDGYRLHSRLLRPAKVSVAK